MGTTDDIVLMSHLMRRAGFGATRDEIERRVGIGYEDTVEELLDPESKPPVDQYMLYRYLPCLLYTSPSPRDLSTSRMPSSA